MMYRVYCFTHKYSINVSYHYYYQAVTFGFQYHGHSIFKAELDFSPNLDPFIEVLVSDLIKPATKHRLR